MEGDPSAMNVCAIRRKSDGYWWECSREHGAGWNARRIRQAWTLREANEEVLRLIETGADASDLEIVELAPKGGEGG